MLMVFMLPAMSGMRASVQWTMSSSNSQSRPNPASTSSSALAQKMNCPLISFSISFIIFSVAKEAANGPLLSSTPRPKSLPFFSKGVKGSKDQSSRTPEGTVSVWSTTRNFLNPGLFRPTVARILGRLGSRAWIV